jgi:F-type H+-transporting ATPase subunit a
MALLVFVSTFVYGIRQRGAGPYFKGFISEPVAKNPVINLLARGFFTGLTILEELLKPVTLALRLFGNIFAGGIMLSLIAALITWQVGHIPVGGVLGVVFNIIWKLFDAVIGAIQAFIFALLTVLYFAMAGSGHGSGDHDEDDAHDDQPAAEPASQTAA